MSSQKEELSLSNKETIFDTYEIDYRINKDGEYIQKTSSELSPKKEITNKFKLIPNLTQEEIQKYDKDNSEYPKYFCTITTKDFDYIGILSNQLKRDKYGYSKMDNGDEFLGEYKNEIRDENEGLDSIPMVESSTPIADSHIDNTNYQGPFMDQQ